MATNQDINQDISTKTYSCGNTEWRNAKGELHRDDDKPAAICRDGTRFWYQHGKCHRDGDKPAIIGADGHQKWYHRGKRHRDGNKPAVIWPDGRQEWYQHGKFMRSSKSVGVKPTGAEFTKVNPEDATLEEAIEQWRAAISTMKAARAAVLNAVERR